MKGFFSKSVFVLLALLLVLSAVPLGAAAAALPSQPQATPGAPSSSSAEESSKGSASPAPEEVYDPNITVTVRYDYDDKVRGGYTIPAFIEIENNGGELEGELRLSVTPERSGEALVYKMAVRVDENASASYVLPFQAISTRNIQVHLYRNGQVVAKAAYPKLGVSLTTKSLLGIFSDNQPAVSYWQSIKELQDSNNEPCQVSPVELTTADFPEKGYLMERFAMIVMNHYDIGLLSAAQREALSDWVRSGGTLLTDADPANAPAVQSLSPMLDVAVTGEASPSGITEKLYELANTAYTDQQEITGLGVVEPLGKVVYEVEEQPLLMEYAVDKGKVYLTTFALSSPAMSHSGVVAGLFGKISGMSATGAYEMEQLTYGMNGGTLREAVRSASWLDAVSIDWVLILIVVFIILAGPVNYAVLAAKDKRDWIWVTAPVLAVVFCVVIVAVGTYQHGGDVISSVASVVDNRGSGNNSSYSEVGIGVPGTGAYEVQIPEDSQPGKYIYSDYYYDSIDAPDVSKVGEPSLLFDLSGQTKVTFPQISRWDMDSFSLNRDIDLQGGLRSEIEQDGKVTRYYVKNETDIPLEDITIVAPGGYIRIPLLEPGEEKSGELGEYAASQSSGYSYVVNGGQLDYWMILSELYASPEQNYYMYGYATGAPEQDDRTEDQKRDDYAKYAILNSLLGYNNYGTYTFTGTNASQTAAQYTLWAWSRTLGELSMEVNGKPVKNEQNLTVILDNAVFNFETEKGLFIPGGFISGYASNVSGIVNGSAYIGGTDGYLTEGEIIYDFKLPEQTSRYELTSLTVQAANTYGAYWLHMKNQVTGEWDEIWLDKAVTDGELKDYIDAENTVQVRIMQSAGSSDAGFSSLTLAVEGKVK